MNSLALQEGGQLKYHGRVVTISSLDPDFIVLGLGGPYSYKLVPIKDFYKEIEEGFIEEHSPSYMVVKETPVLNEEEMAMVKKYKAYLTVLDNEESPCSKLTRIRVIEQVSRERSDVGKNCPSPSTLYNWYKKYTSAEVNRDFIAMVAPRKRKRGHKACHLALDLFWEIMDEDYLKLKTEGALSKAACYEKFNIKWKALQSSLSKDEKEGSHGICRSTFYELVKSIDPIEVCIARKGRTFANKRYRISEGHIVAERPLELVQIDAVHLNLGLRDGDGNYVGMPVVFFAIDVFTRAILSYVISYAKVRREDLSSAIELVRSSILPKEKPEHTKNDWPIFGKIETIQHDSGIFRSKQFGAFLVNAKTSFQQNQVGKPWNNALVERFNGTFRRGCVAKIPGYAGKPLGERKDTVNIELLAYTEVKVFRRIVERYILDEYHQRPHRGLNDLTPQEMCEKYKELIIQPSPSEIKLINNFQGVEFVATIQAHKGIEKNKLLYNSKDLRKIFLQKGGKQGRKNPQVSAYYSEIDVSKISVFDEELGELVSIPCTTINETMALAEFKAKTNKVNNKKASTPVDILAPELKEVNETMKADKKQKELAKQKKKTEKEAKSEKDEEYISSPKTEQEWDQVINKNSAGINAAPLLSKDVKEKADESKPRGRTKQIKQLNT